MAELALPTDSNARARRPHLLEFPRRGEPATGYLAVLDDVRASLPFAVERVFWTYHTPEAVVRGHHAHHRTEQVLVALGGRIDVTVETSDGAAETFTLDAPNVGLYVPPSAWRTMRYSEGSLLLVFASTAYDETDHIRDRDRFQVVWGG